MDVTISVPGRFHAPKTARGLHDRGLLRHYYSSHPKRNIPSVVPRDKVTSIWPAELLGQLGYRAPWLEQLVPVGDWNRPLFRGKQRLFDWSVAKLLPDANEDSIFVGYSGSLLSSLDSANERGYTTVLERSSAHIQVQKEILDDAYSTFRPDKTPPISERFVERELREYERADNIVVPSTFVANTFRQQGVPDQKLHIVPLGVAPDRVPDTTSRSSDARPPRVREVVGEEPYLLFIGRTGIRKGIPYLLEAWTDSTLSDHELVIVGAVQPGVEEQLADTPDDVHVLGFEDEIDRWYQHADVFVFPSLEDGFGRVVLESLNCGTPVIVTERTGAKDCIVADEDGIVIPAGDSDELAAAMEEAVDRDWDRERIAARVSGEHTWDQYTDTVIETYQGMIK